MIKMDFLILGLNHKTAPVEIRERVSFSRAKIIDALKFLQGYPSIEECLILSTCNRVELYCLSQNKIEALNELKRFFYEYHELRQSLEQYLYVYENKEAVRHLFRVASSLDSMIVGENQILHQTKQAYLAACEAGSAKKCIPLIFQEALRVGKKVRAQTEISKGVVSVSSAAVELAKNVLKDLEDKKILIIGAGKISELTLKGLTGRGIKLVFVANRTYERAVRLADACQGVALRFAQLNEALKEVDVVISSTSAPHYILRKRQLASIADERGARPLVIIDLGMPRNIEETSSEIDKVYLYNIDDLQKISETNLQERLKEALKAEEMIGVETERCYTSGVGASYYKGLPLPRGERVGVRG